MEKWDANSVNKPELSSGAQPESPVSPHTEQESLLLDVLKRQAEATAKQTEALLTLCEHLEMLTTQTAIMLDILIPAAEEELAESETPQYLSQRTRSQ